MAAICQAPSALFRRFFGAVSAVALSYNAGQCNDKSAKGKKRKRP
jgi:hypothetical protein